MLDILPDRLDIGSFRKPDNGPAFSVIALAFEPSALDYAENSTELFCLVAVEHIGAAVQPVHANGAIIDDQLLRRNRPQESTAANRGARRPCQLDGTGLVVCGFRRELRCPRL